MPATSHLPCNRLDALVDGILAITMTLLAERERQ
ncbi:MULTISPECIES: TMEM175 family protein [unclassified Mesorhizobium]|nr:MULTISPECIES: TMEM175 family protein [unclassified Mesorhizobium]